MDKLKSTIPESIKHKISSSNLSDLESTSSLLLNHFRNLPLFNQMVRELTDPEMALCGKDKEAALEAKAKGNECFRKGDYSGALRFYTKALRVAPLDVDELEKNLVATLYLNRATSLHKLGLFLESLRDCTRALIIFPSYAKAWFRRAKANSSLGNYEDASRDLNVSLKMETSVSGKKQIQSELNMHSGHSKPQHNPLDKPDYLISDEPLQTELCCVSTPHKGRGMASYSDIRPASLIHLEDPYAAIILKHCRETHCAFCFNELPEDVVPCSSCSIPLYCSLPCQVRAGGRDFPKYANDVRFPDDLSDDLERHVRNVTSIATSDSNHEHAAEHWHECRGMHWAVVLPSDVVLAGRIIAKHIKGQSFSGIDPKIHSILDLCQNYAKLSPESKLEFHLYSIVLLCCLQIVFASELPLNSTTTSQIIILLSQIRVNSMAIVRMKDSGTKNYLDCDVTSSVEQVQVAQAVYCRGSLFNHSCQPNIHSYFISRTLFIRATEHIVAGEQLELSYGPQVGQWNRDKRRQLLGDRYSFICHCRGCDQLNLADLVHSGYRCNKADCFGVVLDSHVAKHEGAKQRNHLQTPNSLQKEYVVHEAADQIIKAARRVYEQRDHSSCCFEAGHCLSCGSLCDLKSSEKTAAKAEINLKRLQDAVTSGEISAVKSIMDDSEKSIVALRGVLHPFNKRIAEAEDNIAQALCLVGEQESALQHCRVSIEILEKLYGEDHIVIGHELIKLASIQLLLSAGPHKEGASRSIDRLSDIFSRNYGSHAEAIFPVLRYFKGEASKLLA